MDKRCRRLLRTLSLVRRRRIATWLRFMYWIILQKVYFAKSWSRRFSRSWKFDKMEMLLLCTGKNKKAHKIRRGLKFKFSVKLPVFLWFFSNFKPRTNSDLNGSKKRNERPKSENLQKPELQRCKRQVTS